VSEIVAAVHAATGARLGIHAQDDTGCAVANSVAAVLAGVTHVQGTMNGYGERTGNANLIGCIANLPPGASGFTTIELKSNHLGTAKQGTLACVATPVHVGKTTQVWDAVVTHQESGKVLALFRCTQLVLYPR